MLLVHFSVIANVQGYAPIIAFFCWHSALYIFNRYTDRLEDARNFPEEAMDDYHATLSLWISFALLAIGASLLFLLGMPLVYYLASLPLVFLYGLRIPGFHRRIKDVVILKNLYAVLVCWCLPVLLLALTYSNSWAFSDDVVRFVLLLAFYITCYEILADIKDVRGDRQSGVDTIAVRYGVMPARAMVLSIVFIAWLVSHISYDFFSYPFALLIIAFVPFIGEGRPALYFHGLVFATLSAVMLYYFSFVFPFLSGFSL
nr:UbiA family prenyltransferase [Alcanivorax sp. 1008]